MDVIRKKINIDKMKSYIPGILPYIQGKGDFKTGGDNGNWGSFPINIPIKQGEETKYMPYQTLLQAYRKLKSLIDEGLKLKRIMKGSTSQNVYTTRFKEDFPLYTDMEEYSFNDINSFEVDDRGNYRPIAEYASDLTLPDYLVLIFDWEAFKEDIGFGEDCVGYQAYKKIVSYIGILNVDTTIKGNDVPRTLYFTEIRNYYNQLLRYKNGDCCDIIRYQEMGGEEMENFLLNHYNDVDNIIDISGEDKNKLMPVIDIPIMLDQTFDDIGVLTTYETTEQTEDIEEEKEKEPEWHEGEDLWVTESKLSELRTREKIFDNDTGEILPYIPKRSSEGAIVPEEYQIPYKKGEIFNKVLLEGHVLDETDGKYYNIYSCDSIKNIIYHVTEDDEGTETMTDDSNFVEFRYVIGGKYIEEDTSAPTECEIDVLDENKVSISTPIIFTRSGDSSRKIFVKSSCSWIANIIYDETAFLEVLDISGRKYGPGAQLALDAFKGTLDIIVNTTTKWTISCEKCSASPNKGTAGTQRVTLTKTNDIVAGDTLVIKYGEEYENQIVFNIREELYGKYIILEPSSFEPVDSGDHTVDTLTVKVISNVVWEVSTDANWMDVYYINQDGVKTRKGGEEGAVREIDLVISIEENKNWNKRSSSVLFTSGKYVTGFTIEQKEPSYITVYKEDVNTPVTDLTLYGDTLEESAKVYCGVLPTEGKDSSWECEIEYEPYLVALTPMKVDEEIILSPVSQLEFSAVPRDDEGVLYIDTNMDITFFVKYQGETTDDKSPMSEGWCLLSDDPSQFQDKVPVKENTYNQARYAELIIKDNIENTELLKIRLIQNKKEDGDN